MVDTAGSTHSDHRRYSLDQPGIFNTEDYIEQKQVRSTSAETRPESHRLCTLMATNPRFAVDSTLSIFGTIYYTPTLQI